MCNASCCRSPFSSDRCLRGDRNALPLRFKRALLSDVGAASDNSASSSLGRLWGVIAEGMAQAAKRYFGSASRAVRN